jgi:hypothetical protein
VLSAAFRHIRPNWRHYIKYVDAAARAGDEQMARYRACFLSLSPKDQLVHWPEQLCDLTNTPPADLVGAVCKALWSSGTPESSMVSAIAQPEVLTETVKFAMQPENYRDRELLFRAWGMLPDKKGTSINIINQPSTQTAVKLGGEEPRLKSFDEEVIEMGQQLDAPFLVKPDVPS